LDYAEVEDPDSLVLEKELALALSVPVYHHDEQDYAHDVENHEYFSSEE